jgi:hypothetical protein
MEISSRFKWEILWSGARLALNSHRLCIAIGAVIYIGTLSLMSAAAATYYVDFSAGSDTNNGTSMVTSWKHSPGDFGATGAAGSTGLVGGDTVIFKGGVNYTNTITLLWSGAAGNPVTYDGNSAGTFGSGRAVSSGNNSTNQIYGFYGSGKSNLVFRNIESTLWGGHGSIAWSCGASADYPGYGIYLNACNYVTVRDSYFHDLGDWTNAPNMSEQYMEGTGVEVFNSGWGITVTNCEFTHIGMDGIIIEPKQGAAICTNIVIVNNNFHDYVRWCIDLASGADNCTLSDVIIDGNQIHDLYQYYTAGWLGCSGLWPHTDPIIMRLANNPPVGGQTLGTTSQPIVVRNNTFYQNPPSQYAVGTAAIFMTTFGGRVLIYNNTFVNALYLGDGTIYCQDGVDPAASPNARPDYHFYNNTFLGDTYCVMLRTVTTPLASFALTNGTVRVKNNIFYKTDNGAAFQVEYGEDGYSTPTEIDYNIYYSPTRPDKDVAHVWASGVGLYEDFAGLQALGWEAHGMYTNPTLVDVSYGVGPKSSLNNVHLQTNSPSIGAGVNLSAYFTTDKNGLERPQVGPWDIGAYKSTNPVRLRIFEVH